MALISVAGITIRGISSVIPAIELDNCDINDSSELNERLRITDSTGIKKRRVVTTGQTCLDLAQIAARDFLAELEWRPDEIGLLIFVTQTPDYPFPGNAVQMQHSLGLSKSTIAFDVNLGCSGYVYGMWQTAQLLSGLHATKALLIVGDTTSIQYGSNNRAVNGLFGDAVSVIGFEKNPTANEMIFSLGTDGAGAPYLIQPHRGAKKPDLPAELFMDGTQVFVFTLKEVPNSILACMQAKEWALEDVDFSIMHQANEMMLRRLGQKIGFSDQQLIISMGEVGNTSSASIPLAMSMSLQTPLTSKTNKLLLSGFGVGWSWGTVAYEQTALKVCRLLDLRGGDSYS